MGKWVKFSPDGVNYDRLYYGLVSFNIRVTFYQIDDLPELSLVDSIINTPYGSYIISKVLNDFSSYTLEEVDDITSRIVTALLFCILKDFNNVNQLSNQ